MIDVIDLSYFIIKRTNDNNNPISHLQLQKMLFFLQKMNKEVMEKFYQNQFLNRLGLLEDEKTLEKEINTFFKELETKYFEKTEIKPLLETI